ncbi:MAG: DNRLRE domain-containing protein [Chloroflexi bacterium]|nr:MAG: DNRLRE domain-containing protein [Chloroflexota bacterium]
MTIKYRDSGSLVKTKGGSSNRSLKWKIFIFIVLMIAVAINVVPILAGSKPGDLGSVYNSPIFQTDPDSELVFKAEADARVEERSPTTNAGTSDYLEVIKANNGDVESYLRFTVSGISDVIQSARLRVYSTTDNSENGPAVYATDNHWTETEINWDNRPRRLGDPSDNKDLTKRYSWVEYDVTGLVAGNGTYSFVLAGDSNDAVMFSSRESSNGPQLILIPASSAPAPTSTPAPAATSTASPFSAGDNVLVGAGDIATCDRDQDELTAQLLDNIPGTVFAVGDNAYKNGTYTEYTDCYDPTWGRHKSRTRPSPGNHEYNTSGAAGYFQYFDNIPSYYAYDIDSWRLYVLNSEIDVSATSEQVVWLLADLAANPRQCVLAYWHRPRWSSGSKHGDNPEMQTIWQIFYEAGAEVVLNGHEHNYERFAEMDGSGAEASAGLREFVVGTGGAGLYPIGTPLAASEVRDDTTFGVLKLTLHETGYDWEFVPTADSAFTDSGSGNCR